MNEEMKAINAKIKKLAVKLESAGLFEKPKIAEQMLAEQLRFNALVISALGGA